MPAQKQRRKLLILFSLICFPCCCALDTRSTRGSAPTRRALLRRLTTNCAAPLLITPSLSLTLPFPASALSPDQASQQYDAFASDYDKLDGGDLASVLGIDQARATLIQKATGHVLEIGVGTGLNLPLYRKEKIKSLTIVDISKGMLQQASKRAEALDNLKEIPIKTAIVDATRALEAAFGPDAFDTVIDSFSLCVMGNDGAQTCLDQMKRVVKVDTGRLLLLENSKSSNPFLGRYQDATADAASSMGGKGCVYNQNVANMIRLTRGLEIVVEKEYAAGLFRSFECKKLS